MRSDSHALPSACWPQQNGRLSSPLTTFRSIILITLTLFCKGSSTDGAICKVALVVGFRRAVQSLASTAVGAEAGTSNRAQCLDSVALAVTGDESLAVVRGYYLGRGWLVGTDAAPARAVFRRGERCDVERGFCVARERQGIPDKLCQKLASFARTTAGQFCRVSSTCSLTEWQKY
jgi:hypothetical protein